MEKGRLIRLNDNWVSVAINHLDHFGDVSYLDFRFLEKLLPHCSKEQLLHIEKSTKKVDLSPITHKLWMKFFETDFGCKATDEMIQRMKINNLSYKWSELYQEKSKRRKKAEKQVGQKLKKLYGCNVRDESDQGSQNIDAEVFRIKEVLQNSENEKANEASMIDSLARLKMIAVTVETLEATKIGKVVNGLKRHGSKQIRDLAGTLVDGWKVMVNEYLAAQNPKEIVAVKPANKASNNNEENRQCLEDEAAKAKIGATKRKLHESYEQIETAKKQRRIQVLDDVPKQGPKVGSHTTKRNTKASTPWMKKLRKSYLNSLEGRNLQAMQRMKKVV